MRRLFEGLARTNPLVVLLDDLHWAEADVPRPLRARRRRLAGFPILLIGIARPELLDERPGWADEQPDVTPIRLQPLTDAECGELIANLLDRAPLPPAAGAAIARASAGNALFAEEFVAMLVDEGLLSCEDGRWVALPSDLSEMPLPSTIDALLSAAPRRPPRQRTHHP